MGRSRGESGIGWTVVKHKERRMYYKVEAYDDVLVFEADNLEDAQHHFERVVGKVPEEVLTWTEIEVEDIPEGLIPLTFETRSQKSI